jgi:hypothetical protein
MTIPTVRKEGFKSIVVSLVKMSENISARVLYLLDLGVVVAYQTSDAERVTTLYSTDYMKSGDDELRIGDTIPVAREGNKLIAFRNNMPAYHGEVLFMQQGNKAQAPEHTLPPFTD